MEKWKNKKDITYRKTNRKMAGVNPTITIVILIKNE